MLQFCVESDWKTPVWHGETSMAELPEQWWIDVRVQLSDLLTVLDQNDEPLIAAHVAMALECLQARARH